MDVHERGTLLCHARRLAFYFNISFYLMQHTTLWRSKFRILRIKRTRTKIGTLRISRTQVQSFTGTSHPGDSQRPTSILCFRPLSKHNMLMSTLASFKKLLKISARVMFLDVSSTILSCFMEMWTEATAKWELKKAYNRFISKHNTRWWLTYTTFIFPQAFGLQRSFSKTVFSDAKCTSSP